VRLTALAALLVALAFPASAADNAILAFGAPSTATLTVDSTRTQAESDYFRGVADAFGNRDGTVSESEATQGAALARPIVEREIQRQLKGGNLTLDGKAPVTTEVKRITFDNLTGPVAQAVPIRAHAEVAILFDASGGPDHRLYEKVRPRPGQSFNITVAAPAGYQASMEGNPTGDAVHYEVTSAMEGKEILLFVPAVETTTSPAGGLGLALWAVGIALVAARRRR
jgi:hypothetical protein